METDEDFIYISQLQYSNFDTIIDTMLPIICPMTKNMKITEIKASSNSVCNRCNRFVEIYNIGDIFDASNIEMEGLITGSAPSGSSVLSNEYLVFYDATNIDANDAGISCHLCNTTTCDLSDCSGTGDTSFTQSCKCGNALYIPCGNSNEVDTSVFTCSFQDSIVKLFEIFYGTQSK